MYFLKRIEVWSGNRLSRVVKTPKLQFIDSGLLASLTELSPAAIDQKKADLAMYWKVLFMEN